MRTVRLFVSSPRDVTTERERVKYVVEGLNSQFAGVVKFEAAFWEDHDYSAHASTQQQIVEAADCDIVIGIFWKLLGTPLPLGFARIANGEQWPSGSVYEITTAIEARNRPGATRPDVYIFESTQRKTFEENELATAQQQLVGLGNFLGELRRTNGGGIKAFADTDDFGAQVDKLLRNWIEKNIAQEDRVLVWRNTRESPFRGLAVFDRKHAPVFFGRSRRTSRAIDELRGAAQRGSPFLLIVGPSGSGKSSLMRAGLTPLLTAPGIVPDVDRWRTAVLNAGWAASPFDALAKALLVSGAEHDDPGGFGPALPELGRAYHTPELLARVLASSSDDESDGLIGAVAQMLVHALDEAELDPSERAGFKPDAVVRMDLLLLVDQLEEIFAATEEQQKGFVRLLQSLADTRRIWVVATLRADFFDRMILYRPLFALKDKGAQYDLGPPGEAELTEIVKRSAEATGLTYGVDPENGQTLDEMILADAVGGDSLPLLEFTLDELFAQRKLIGGKTYLTVEAYKDMGGISGAINSVAERAINRLSTGDRAALPRLLLSLVVSVRDKDEISAGEHWRTSRLVPAAEAVPDDHAQTLVKALLDTRILLAFNRGQNAEDTPSETLSSDSAVDGSRTVTVASSAASIEIQASALNTLPVAALRIAHERVLRDWKLAKEIIDSHQDFIRIRDEVEVQRRKWLLNNYASDDLITSSFALHDAENNLDRFGPLFSPEIHDFVERSRRRARRERRKKIAAISLIIAVALLALVASIFAGLKKREAEANYAEAQRDFQAALDVTDTFTGKILTDLQAKSASIAVVKDVLQTADQQVNRLQGLRADDASLNKIHASMLLSFARAYQFAQQGKQALEKAAESIDLRKKLVAENSSDRDLQWQLAESLELYGDILRNAFGQLVDARVSFDRVLSIRKKFPGPTPAQTALGLSHIYTRLGDVDMADKNLSSATAQYKAAFDTERIALLQEPQNEDLQRDMSWVYNKLSDILAGGNAPEAKQQALHYLQNSLCLRRRLAYPLDRLRSTEVQRDIGFTLDRMAPLALDLGHRSEGEEFYEVGLGLRKYLSDRDVSNVLYLGDLSISEANMARLYAGDVVVAHGSERPNNDRDIAKALAALTGEKTKDDLDNLEFALGFAQASLDHKARLIADDQKAGDAPNCNAKPADAKSASTSNLNAYCQFRPVLENLCDDRKKEAACLQDTSWQPMVSNHERSAYEQWRRTALADDICLSAIMDELRADKKLNSRAAK